MRASLDGSKQENSCSDTVYIENSTLPKPWQSHQEAGFAGVHWEKPGFLWDEGPARRVSKSPLSYSLNSLKGDYIGGNIGDYYGGY